MSAVGTRSLRIIFKFEIIITEHSQYWLKDMEHVKNKHNTNNLLDYNTFSIEQKNKLHPGILTTWVV